MLHETFLESADIKSLEQLYLHWLDSSLQSRRNFDGRALRFILVTIIAAILDFYGRVGLGREKICTKGPSDSIKERKGEGVGLWINIPLPFPAPFPHLRL